MPIGSTGLSPRKSHPEWRPISFGHVLKESGRRPWSFDGGDDHDAHWREIASRAKTEAAIAAHHALATIEKFADQAPQQLCAHCHAELHARRGVVLALAAIDGSQDTMSWVGVGGVRGVLVRANSSVPRPTTWLIPRAGVVGRQLPRLATATLALRRDDLIVLATDGIGDGFEQVVGENGSPDSIARRILERYGRMEDDALVLVARYRGGVR